MEWGAPCWRTMVRAWPNEHNQLGNLAVPINFFAYLVLGENQMAKASFEPRSIQSESYALPLRRTVSAYSWLAHPF